MQGEGYHAEQACNAFGLASIDAGQHREGEYKESFLANAAQVATGLNMTVAEFLDFDVMNSTIFEDE